MIVNGIAAASVQQQLIDRCELPLFQDVDAVKAWDQHGGGKDDLLVYNAAGVLVRFLPFGGQIDTDMRKAVGYQNVKTALLSAK
ncbi:MAG: hypothetical protein H6707_15400 [Deltaproteobacteria bacterium]|nr:hypothetical protein [Deltaproteobacteria bacterium]